MHIRPFQAVYPNFNYITSVDGFFETVKEDYPEYRRSGFFKKAAQEAIYVYRITDSLHSYTGIIAGAAIEDYFAGRIKKHENTLSAKEQQQMHLMISRNATVKPVLLTYPDVPEINEFMERCIQTHEPFFSTVFELSQQRHTFWEISEGRLIQQLENLFLTKVPVTYIADGHHRTSTTALMYERLSPQGKAGNSDILLSAFFASTQLIIHDYNRVVEGLSDTTLTNFMARISQLFEIEIIDEPQRPEKKHQIAMLVNREWFMLTWKPEVLKAYASDEVILDATLLDEEVISGILGIKDIKTDLRINYVEGPKGIEELRTRTIKNDNRVGFMLYPASLEDLMRVADAGKTMPPKSTWFEPRIKNGLIVLELDLHIV